MAPGSSGDPAVPSQIVGRGRQRVLRGVPDVAAAVAGEIHRIGGIARGYELGVAHGAGPGTGQPVKGDVAGLEDLEGRQQLRAPEPGATALVTERRERANDVAFAAQRSVKRFHAPDGHQHVAVHPVPPFDDVQVDGVLGKLPTALSDARVGDHERHVVGRRQHELGLAVVSLDDFRVGGQAAKSAVVERLRDAVPARNRAKLLDESLVGCLVGCEWFNSGSGRRTAGERAGQDEGCQARADLHPAAHDGHHPRTT